jgi:DNA-binding transcriptional LysR family regulator
MPVVTRFIRDYPDIEMEFDFDNRLVDLVAERFDVAVRITTLTDTSLIARRLAEVRIVTVASPEYLNRAGIPDKPSDLQEHVCLTYSLDRTPSEWHFQDERKRVVSVRVRGRLRCNSDEAQKYAVLDGLGISQFPELFVADQIRSGRLVRLLQGFERPPSSLCAVFPTRNQLPPKVRVFIEHLARHLAR